MIEEIDIYPRVFFQLKPNLLGCSLLCFISLPSWAITQLSLTLGDIKTVQWQAQQVSLSSDFLTAPLVSYELKIKEFYHVALDKPLSDLTLLCEQGSLEAHSIRCETGQVVFTAKEKHQADIRLDYAMDTQTLTVSIQQLNVYRGHVNLALTLANEDWNIDMDWKNIQLGALSQSDWMTLPDTTLSAVLNGKLSASGQGSDLKQANIKLKVTDFDLENEPLDLVAEDLDFSWKATLEAVKKGYRLDQRLSLTSGALLTPFVFLAPEKSPIKINAKAWLSSDLARFNLHQLTYQHKNQLAFDMTGQFNFMPAFSVQKMDLQTKTLELSQLYLNMLQPVMSESAFEDIALSGKLSLGLNMRDEQLTQWQLTLKEMDIKDQMNDPALYEFAGINGDIHWQAGSHSNDSRLSWEAAEFYQRIPVGETAWDFKLQGNALTLNKKTALPIYDGKLNIEALEISQSDAGVSGFFQGIISPISMSQVSQSFEWPDLSGKFSGVIPKVRYNNGKVIVDGTLLMQIFDGTILLKDLELNHLLGVLPELKANVELNNLDLTVLTKTFSFGKITGKLSGTMQELTMENWEPTAFNAHFQTPEDDDSSHRISQRAVDNISNLGGVGLAGALSRTFLRFFEDFHYDKLGISCHLSRGVCKMGGVESAESGYYLVKGGGIPRIDIKGYNRNTDWHLLIKKLKSITHTTPIIK